MGRFLITGGTGMIGAHITRLLVERGERPVVYDVAPRQEALVDLAGKIDLIQGDILNLEQVRATVRDHDVSHIIHTAAMRGLTKTVQERPHTGARLNFEGTLNILEAARREGVQRVVMSSSSTVYFGSLDPLPAKLEESMPLHPPPSIYAATKLAAEHLGRNYGRWFDMEFTAVRYARALGPQRNPITPQGVMMKALVEAALKGEPAEIELDRLDGELLFYKDAARGTLLAAMKEGSIAPVYNIGAGVHTDADQLLEALLRLAPKARITRKPLPPDYPYNFKIPVQSGELAERDLGYTAEYDLERMLAEYIEYLRTERG